MTARNEAQPTSVPQVLGDHQRRIQILEAVAPAATPVSGAAGFPGIIELPIWVRKGTGNFDSAQWTYTIDSAAPGGGYAANGFDGAEQSWLINLGPSGSAWKILVVAAKGQSFGIMDVCLASDPPSAFFAPNEQYPIDGTSVSYAVLESVDYYNGTPQAYPNVHNAQVFQIGGVDGDIGTGFTAGAGIYSGQQIWDGGPGMVRVKLETNGKNGSSSGFDQRISQVALVRVDEGLVA